MFKACPPLLLVIDSGMRKLCRSYLMQSKCGGGETFHRSRRGVQENTVTFAGPPPGRCDFSSWQMLQLLPSQAAPVPASPWPLFLLDVFLLPLRVTDSTVWTWAIIRYLWAVGRKNPVLHGRSWWQERTQKVEEANIPTPAGTFILLSPPDLHFKTSRMFCVFFFFLAFFLS